MAEKQTTQPLRPAFVLQDLPRIAFESLQSSYSADSVAAQQGDAGTSIAASLVMLSGLTEQLVSEIRELRYALSTRKASL